MYEIKVAPSVLSCDFSKMAEQVAMVEQCGADLLHLDVMDANFVPNLTFGCDMIRALRKSSQLKFDVHLMVTNPEKMIKDVVKSGADYVSVHVEATNHIHNALRMIKNENKKAGIALNPGTSLECIDYLMDVIDYVVIMAVNPGYGGQMYIPSTTEKISCLKKKLTRASKHDIEIEVDGGIEMSTIGLAAGAGANIAVAGSYIYHSNNIATAISILKSLSV